MLELSRIGVKAVRAVCSNREVLSSSQTGIGNTVYIYMHVTKYICFSLMSTVLMSFETAVSDPWRQLFKDGKIVAVAVDEAHCISEWLVSDILCQ